MWYHALPFFGIVAMTITFLAPIVHPRYKKYMDDRKLKKPKPKETKAIDNKIRDDKKAGADEDDPDKVINSEAE
jgi:hypothetical protein